MPDRILVSRLLEFYNPLSALGLKPGDGACELKWPARSDPVLWGTVKVTRRMHLSRIRWFVENPGAINPIALDNDTGGGWFLGPIVVDGHHRLLAAVRLGWKRIPVEYSGLVSTLRYLQGRRKTVEF
jgi:hypothetical protein